MSVRIADNITSPMGFGTADNLAKVLNGESCIARYDHRWDIPESFMASLFSDDQRDNLNIPGLTFFESVATRSIKSALAELDVNVCLSQSRVVLILSTTKGNVSQLSTQEEYILPSDSARRIADHLGLECDTLVVCNACISGLSAIILANRLLNEEAYDYAIVCGVDVQSDFIVSGFQSLKALSPDECRPFDIERLGLNLGEAAATLVLAKSSPTITPSWHIDACAMTNDAYHISAPSKMGLGLQMVLENIMKSRRAEDIAMINAHGTATMFNDQMEGIALREQNLTSIPVNGLKGYFGHTMGAAGVLETVLSMYAVEQGVVPGTRGFEEIGVSGKLCISHDNMTTDKRQFIKLLSGFGGCNAGIVCTYSNTATTPTIKSGRIHTLHEVLITAQEVSLDGQPVDVECRGVEMLTELYKKYVGDYPKFYKMDHLCRLGFVASELLISAEEKTRFEEQANRGVILFNRHSTTDTDRKYYSSIQDREDFFPSPSVFVYTLPNILTGEIAIRNLYHGETCHYLLSYYDDEIMNHIVETSLKAGTITSAITGWVDYEDDNHFTAKLKIVEYK